MLATELSSTKYQHSIRGGAHAEDDETVWKRALTSSYYARVEDWLHSSVEGAIPLNRHEPVTTEKIQFRALSKGIPQMTGTRYIPQKERTHTEEPYLGSRCLYSDKRPKFRVREKSKELGGPFRAGATLTSSGLFPALPTRSNTNHKRHTSNLSIRRGSPVRLPASMQGPLQVAMQHTQTQAQAQAQTQTQAQASTQAPTLFSYSGGGSSSASASGVPPCLPPGGGASSSVKGIEGPSLEAMSIASSFLARDRALSPAAPSQKHVTTGECLARGNMFRPPSHPDTWLGPRMRLGRSSVPPEARLSVRAREHSPDPHPHPRPRTPYQGTNHQVFTNMVRREPPPQWPGAPPFRSCSRADVGFGRQDAERAGPKTYFKSVTEIAHRTSFTRHWLSRYVTDADRSQAASLLLTRSGHRTHATQADPSMSSSTTRLSASARPAAKRSTFPALSSAQQAPSSAPQMRSQSVPPGHTMDTPPRLGAPSVSFSSSTSGGSTRVAPAPLSLSAVEALPLIVSKKSAITIPSMAGDTPRAGPELPPIR